MGEAQKLLERIIDLDEASERESAEARERILSDAASFFSVLRDIASALRDLLGIVPKWYSLPLQLRSASVLVLTKFSHTEMRAKRLHDLACEYGTQYAPVYEKDMANFADVLGQFRAAVLPFVAEENGRLSRLEESYADGLAVAEKCARERRAEGLGTIYNTKEEFIQRFAPK